MYPLVSASVAQKWPKDDDFPEGVWHWVANA